MSFSSFFSLSLGLSGGGGRGGRGGIDTSCLGPRSAKHPRREAALTTLKGEELGCSERTVFPFPLHLLVVVQYQQRHKSHRGISPGHPSNEGGDWAFYPPPLAKKGRRRRRRRRRRRNISVPLHLWRWRGAQIIFAPGVVKNSLTLHKELALRRGFPT